MYFTAVYFQDVHCILELVTEDFEFHGSIALVGNILQFSFSLVNVHILNSWILVPGFEGFHADTPVILSDLGLDVGIYVRRILNVARDDVMHHQLVHNVSVPSMRCS